MWIFHITHEHWKILPSPFCESALRKSQTTDTFCTVLRFPQSFASVVSNNQLSITVNPKEIDSHSFPLIRRRKTVSCIINNYSRVSHRLNDLLGSSSSNLIVFYLDYYIDEIKYGNYWTLYSSQKRDILFTPPISKSYC